MTISSRRDVWRGVCQVARFGDTSRRGVGRRHACQKVESLSRAFGSQWRLRREILGKPEDERERPVSFENLRLGFLFYTSGLARSPSIRAKKRVHKGV